MASDEIGQKLHDQATRGTALSTPDQAQLEQWYAQQDQCESDALARAAPAAELVELRRDVDGALAELQSVTERIKALTSENEALKQEIATLERQLKNAQPA